MKITGFAQLRNEREKRNLEDWFRCMNEVCDDIFVFDQASDDNSHEIYGREQGENKKLKIFQSQINNFSNEVGCKSFLLKKLLEDQPDTDWILWLDGDSFLTKGLLDYNNIRKVLSSYEDMDAVRLYHYNLWRSDTHYRMDDSYNGLNVQEDGGGGVISFWRNNGRLEFPDSGGLHTRVHPIGADKSCAIDERVKEMRGQGIIHRGFATDYQIMTKYDVYGARGQCGWALDRLLEEGVTSTSPKGLETSEINKELLPEWYKLRGNQVPHCLKRIRKIYQEIKGII